MLITADNIKRAGLRISQRIENQNINTFIQEAEAMYIRERITHNLYVDLLEYVKASDKSKFPKEYEILLNGGIYETNGEKRIFNGLIEAIFYYTHSRLVKKNDENVSRFGFVQKDDDYSTQHDLKTKLIAEKDSLTIADIYLNDCILYIESNTDKFPLFKKAGVAKNRIRLNFIGSF